MEKPKFSGKTILKLAGALLALAYLGFCLYAGITGQFPGMHKKEHVMRFGELKNWVAGGISAMLIFVLCINSAINDRNLQKGRKKSSFPFFLIVSLISFPLLLEAYLDIGWTGVALYAGIAAVLFGIAWVPQILNQWIARSLLREKIMSGRQQVQIIEWIHFYPLKKLLAAGLWSFGVLVLLCGIWETAAGEIEMDGQIFLTLLIVAVLVAALFQKMKRYVSTPCHSIPVLNQILSKKQLEQLLDGERFEKIPFEDTAMKQYLEIYRSENWMLIGGKLLSKKLALWATVSRAGSDTTLKVLYLNGRIAKAKVNLEIRENRYEEFTAVLRELTGYEGSLELYGKEEELAQKFVAALPDYASEQERLAAFLTQDAAEIRQDYMRMFSPPDTRKKKRARQEQKQ
ncbi:hypothetical protein [Parablautia sp. Marseille-Q6255]|uniref:hypothetical protein n=1 Tax=Parablautia sp. Marseille-Q6255 TaxID=3039593 RepID=UPI0024BBFB4E|nr:hypothetical protein [Parablautia sp. Marseille-Q6255]